MTSPSIEPWTWGDTQEAAGPPSRADMPEAAGPPPRRTSIRIGAALFDTLNLELIRDGAAILLQPLPARLLHYLVTHRDRLVSKEELHRVLWPQTFVSDAALASALRDLRRAIGDDGKAQDFVRTYRGRGYRLVAPVSFGSLHGHLRAVSPPGPGPGGETVPARARELGQLGETLERVRKGQGASVVVEGEPASGKSDLLARFRGSAEGVTCVAVTCQEESWVPPYDAMGRALLQIKEVAGGERFDAWVGRPGGLSEILPELGASRQGEPSRPLAVERGLVRFLARVCAEGPLALCFDDLHLADPGSRRLVQALSARAESLPLLILATVDHSRLDRVTCEPFTPTRWLRLKALSVGAAERLSRRALGDRVDREWAHRLHEHTGGGAGPLVALLEEAARSKARVPQPENLPVPAAVSAAVRERWGRLTPAARRIAVAAAALPGDACTSQVVAIADLGEDAPAALAEAVEARFLDLRADTMKVRLRSALLGRAILDLLPPDRERQLALRARRLLGSEPLP